MSSAGVSASTEQPDALRLHIETDPVMPDEWELTVGEHTAPRPVTAVPDPRSRSCAPNTPEGP